LLADLIIFDFCLFVKVSSYVTPTCQRKLKSWAFLFCSTEEASRGG